MILIRKNYKLLWNVFLLAFLLCIADIKGYAQAQQLSHSTTNNSQLAQWRQYYQTFSQFLSNKDLSQAQKTLPKLSGYVLYPYAQYDYFMTDLTKVSLKQGYDFVLANSDLAITKTFIEKFVTELARRQDWQGILHFSNYPPSSRIGQCYYYYAQWVLGDKSIAYAGAQSLWFSGESQPTACDLLFKEWQKAGYQTDDLVYRRVALALEQSNKTLAKKLLSQLPPRDQKTVAAITATVNNPTELIKRMKDVPVSDKTQPIMISLFLSLIKSNVLMAKSVWNDFSVKYKLSMSDQIRLEDAIASRLFDDNVSPDNAKWRDKIIKKNQNVNLLERRLRMCIREGDKAELRQWLAKLPDDVKQKDVWQYWLADVMLASSNKAKRKQGKQILISLSQRRGYYPMLSAQRLKIAYQLRVNSAYPLEQDWQNDMVIQRVTELLYWDKNSLALQEWRYFVAGFDEKIQSSLANYALQQGWGELSVAATIVGKLWDNLEERFPIVFRDIFKKAITDKSISKYYAMAIARQESALNPLAMSPVGARGLMQLMPQTAKDVAKRQKVASYTKTDQLFDPEMNISLGTMYLDYVFQRYDNNRILSTAAYNAGPNRVDLWLKQSNGKLDAASFIEAIPFGETRNYVQNVLAYDVFYRYFLEKKAGHVLSDIEWKRHY